MLKEDAEGAAGGNADAVVEDAAEFVELDEPAPAAPEEPAAPRPAESGIAGQLRFYKSLLEEDLITQEDYDAKKRQILGL